MISTGYSRQFLVAALAVAAALLMTWAAPRAWGEQSGGDVMDLGPAGAPYVSGELLLALNTDAEDKPVADLIKRSSASVEDTLPDLDSVLISLPWVKSERSRRMREDDLERIRQSLEKSPLVEAADYNYVRTASFTPNDKLFGRQWNMRVPNYPQAWDKTRGGGVKIGIVDSGIAARHADLKGKVAAQRDFVNGDGKADDRVKHGTHVSGIAAAKTDNHTGVAGGCPNCKLVVAKSLGVFGGTDRDIAKGINWTVKRGAKVVNLSLGGPGRSTVLKRAVNRAWKRGAVVVAAAGNENTSKPSYPAAYSRAIAVAATNRFDKRARFSNHGKWVDVSAPGVDIVSTIPGGYRSYSGTSMSTPHVSALAGLLSSRGFSKRKIRSRITATAVDLGKKGRDPYYGSGRIDAARAVR